MRKRETHKHIHTQREAYSSGAATPPPRQPLRLRGSALDQNDLRLREQPTGLQADPSSRSRGHDFWGDSPEQRPGGPEAGMRRCFPRTPPVLSTSWSAFLPRLLASGDSPVHPVKGSGWSLGAPPPKHCHGGLLSARPQGVVSLTTVGTTVTQAHPLATRACALAGPSRAPLPAVRLRPL